MNFFTSKILRKRDKIKLRILQLDFRTDFYFNQGPRPTYQTE